MRRLAVLALGSFVCGVFAAIPAAAQPSAGTVFVSAAALAVIDEAPDAAAAGLLPANDTGGTVAGGALGLGVHLTPRLSVRAEMHLAGRVKKERQLPGILGGATSPFGGGSSVFTVTQTVGTTREATPVFALLAYHLTAARVSVEFAGGLGLVRQSVTSTFDTVVSGAGLSVGSFPPSLPRTQVSASGYHAVAVVGADAAVSATSHLAVVPQVRAYVLNGGLSLRPGLGLRWTF